MLGEHIESLKIRIINEATQESICFDDIDDAELYVEENDGDYQFSVRIKTSEETIKESFDSFEEMTEFIDETYADYSKTII